VLPATGYTCFHVATVSKFLAVKILLQRWKEMSIARRRIPPDKIAISAGSLVTKVHEMYIYVLDDSLRNVS
jgi:hypothetical protein